MLPEIPRPDAVTRQRRAVGVLLSVSQMVAGDLKLASVLRSAMAAAAEAMNAEACSILLQDGETGELAFRLAEGDHTSGLDQIRIPTDDHSIAGWTAKHGRSLLVPEAYEDSRFNRGYDARTGFRTHSLICVPLQAKQRQLGVIQILNRRDGRPFDGEDLELAEAVASLIAVAIHNAEEHEARVSAERVASIGQAIAGMAHCIKNILNGLRGGAYIIDQNLDQEEGNEPLLRGWAMVRRNQELLSGIVLDMLSYSKARKPVVRPSQIDDLCLDVIALHQARADDEGVMLVGKTDMDLPLVPIDETAIRRCLINLVGNAIDACKESKGTVTIETGRNGTGSCLALRVSDTGCGMDEATARKVFAPFFSTKGNKGTGLGLAVTLKIVEEHGGSIAVDSTPGVGTEFVIELPFVPAGE